MLGFAFLLCLFPLVSGRPSFTNDEFDITIGLSFVVRWKDAKEPVNVNLWSTRDLEANIADADKTITSYIATDHNGTSIAWIPGNLLWLETYVFEIIDANGENNFSKPWKLKGKSVAAASSRAAELASESPGDIPTASGLSSAPTDILESATTEILESSTAEVIESSSFPNLWDVTEGLTSSFTTLPKSSTPGEGPRQTSSTGLDGPNDRTPPPNSSEAKSNSAATSGLNTGAKIGIGVGCGLLGIVILVGAGFFIYRRGQKSASPKFIVNSVARGSEGSDKGSSTLAAPTPQPHEMNIVSDYNEMDVVSHYHELGNEKLADQRRSQEPFEL